jgi:putative transposase
MLKLRIPNIPLNTNLKVEIRFMFNKISTIQKSLKVRLYPTPEQKIILNKTFGCCRLLYNERLVEHNLWYEQNKDLPKEDRSKFKGKLPKELRETKYDFLCEDTIAEALIQSQRNCEQAYSNFFKSLSGKRKGRKVSYPRFKKKSDHKGSFTLFMLRKNCFDFDHRQLLIPKLGKTKFTHAEDKSQKWIGWYKKAVPRHMTISKNPAGEYWCSILFEKQQDNFIRASLDNAIGLDFSPSSLYVNDLNETALGYKPQKQLHLKQLKHLQRNLARKKAGSRNREKARVKLARLEQHIADSRRDYIEKETLRLVREYDLIGIEDLNLVGMMKFSHNAKNYVDTSWSTFVNKLIWKAKFNDCLVIQSDRFYPSSKTCHHCGHINNDLKLSDRVWTCPNCGAEIIRDQNAAINLKNNAKSMLCKDLTPF